MKPSNIANQHVKTNSLGQRSQHTSPNFKMKSPAATNNSRNKTGQLHSVGGVKQAQISSAFEKGNGEKMASTGGWNNPDFSTLKESFALAPTLKDMNITAGELTNRSLESAVQSF